VLIAAALGCSTAPALVPARHLVLVTIDALRRNPRDARLFEAQAGILRQLEKPREALLAYRKAIELAPRDGLLHAKLGELLRDAGEPEPAIAQLREAVALDPELAAYWNSLGMVLGGSNRLAEATWVWYCSAPAAAWRPRLCSGRRSSSSRASPPRAPGSPSCDDRPPGDGEVGGRVLAPGLAAVGETTEVPRRSPSRGPPYWKSQVPTAGRYSATRRAVAGATAPGGDDAA